MKDLLEWCLEENGYDVGKAEQNRNPFYQIEKGKEPAMDCFNLSLVNSITPVSENRAYTSHKKTLQDVIPQTTASPIDLANKKEKKSSNKSNLPVGLCKEAMLFKDIVYQIFTNGAKVDKKIISKAHKLAQDEYKDKVKPILRDEKRSIGLYFQRHYPEARTLIPFLKMEFDKNHDLIMSAAKSK